MEPEYFGLAFLLLASGFVSGSETALFSLDMSTKHFGKRPIDRLISTIMSTEHRLLLTILMLNNVINVLYFAWATVLASRYDVATGVPALVAGGALLGLILFGEVMPKVVATTMPLRFARVTVLPLYFSMRLLTPAHVLAERFLGNLVMNAGSAPAGSVISDDELKLVISASKEQGVVSGSVHDRLIEIVDLGGTLVGAVMQHRLDCPQVNNDVDVDAVIDVLRQKPAAYVLVNDEEGDCVGLVTPQDLLRGGSLNRRMRKPLYIPANVSCSQALQLFQERKRSVAVVVDEFGGTLGLITLRDLANELMTSDQGDGVIPAPEQIDSNRYVLPGGQPLVAWEALIDEGDRQGCHTIGGFVTKQLGGLPQPGDRYLYNNLLFKILDLRGRRIGRMEVAIIDAYEARRMTAESRLRKMTTKVYKR